MIQNVATSLYEKKKEELENLYQHKVEKNQVSNFSNVRIMEEKKIKNLMRNFK